MGVGGFTEVIFLKNIFDRLQISSKDVPDEMSLKSFYVIHRRCCGNVLFVKENDAVFEALNPGETHKIELKRKSIF